MQAIVDMLDTAAPRDLVTLLYAPGRRPDAAAVEALAAAGAGSRTGAGAISGTGPVTAFAVTHRPAPQAQWLELLTTGLTFDLRGLAPGAAAGHTGFVHRYGLRDDAAEGDAEALTIAPGPHLAGGEGLLPVVRAAAGLALALAALPGAVAIGWRPARALSGAAHFRASVGAWLAGGAFPALGLTALERAPDGAMTSEGLAALIGQELWLEPAAGSAPADDARLAVRLIDRLIATGAIRQTMTVEPIAGHRLTLEPDVAARLVRARRIAR